MGGLPKGMLPQAIELGIGSPGRPAWQWQCLGPLGALGSDPIQHLRQGSPPVLWLDP